MGLKVQNVTKTFDDFVAIENVSFEVVDGEFVCLLGPSGCGKSTLLRLIAGLDKPTGGEIFLDGERIKGTGADRGFVFQEYALFPWRTVRRNIEFGLEIRKIAKEERRRISQKYINLVNLAGFENYRPRKLSAGMRQRVAIARALANDPKLLLMDEPFGALDAQTRNIMQEELLRIWSHAKKTVLFVTHSVDEAIFLADRIIVLSSSPGRIIEIRDVKIDRPRSRTSADASGIRDHILGLLALEINKVHK
jgi:NitT/TauT family transport system ATP-binding protein